MRVAACGAYVIGSVVLAIGGLVGGLSARTGARMSVQTFTVSEDEDGMRLDRWFKRRVPDLSLSHLNKIVRTGQVRVDGGRVKTATRLLNGQAVRVPPLKLDAQPPKAAAVLSQSDAQAVRAMILHEDRDLMVLNKPFGLAVQGGSGTPHHLDGMLAALPNAAGDRPVLVHRLDRDTSGVLLVAKTRRMAADLGEIFRSRQAQKIYWALVEGVPKPTQGRISLYLAKGEGMDDRRAGPRRDGNDRAALEKMRVARHGRGRRAAFRHLLRHPRQGRAAARLAVDEADHRANASIARARRGDRPFDRRRSQIRPEAEERSAPDQTRCGRSRTPWSASCTCSPAASSCPIPAAARST